MKRIIVKTLIVLLVLLLSTVAVFGCLWKNTDIPKLYFEGDISGMESKSDERSIQFTYEDGQREINGFASIKIQGTSSIFYEKKNYTLKFYKDDMHEDKLKIDVGWGEQYKYCMKANWIDRTHARNVVSARLVGKMQNAYGLLTQAPNHGAIDGFPVEIYSNGEFLGLYTFNIPKDAWTFAMDDDDPNHIVICGEGWEDANLFKAMPTFDSWAVEVGNENEATQAAMDRLFDFVINSTDAEFKANFHDYINLDAALNYYVFADVAWLGDNRGKNMLLATYDGREWYPSLYDLDTSWGTNYDGLSLTKYESQLLNMTKSNLFARMETVFPEELAQRYFELRTGILSNENILSEFDTFRKQVPRMTYLKETIRWGSGVIRRSSELPGADFEQIEQYLNSVSSRLDQKYMDMLAQ